MARSNRINSVCVTAGEYKCENRLGLAEKAPWDFVIYDSVLYPVVFLFMWELPYSCCVRQIVGIKKTIFFFLQSVSFELFVLTGDTLYVCCVHTHPYTHYKQLHQTDRLVSGNDLYFICLVCKKTQYPMFNLELEWAKSVRRIIKTSLGYAGNNILLTPLLQNIVCIWSTVCNFFVCIKYNCLNLHYTT